LFLLYSRELVLRSTLGDYLNLGCIFPDYSSMHTNQDFTSHYCISTLTLLAYMQENYVICCIEQNIVTEVIFGE